MYFNQFSCNGFRGGGYGMMGNYGYGRMMGGFGHHGFPFLGFFVFIFLIVLIIYLYKKGNLSTTYSLKNRNYALEILKQRYAKGEITLEQFNEMKRNLE